MQLARYHENLQRGTLDFPLSFYHLDVHHPRYVMPFHWHDECEIVLVEEGELELHLDLSGTGRLMQRGEVAFLHPGCLHGAYPKDCVYDCIVFDAQMLYGKNAGPCGERLNALLGGKLSVLPFFEADHPAVQAALLPLLQNLLQPQEGAELSTLGCLYSFFGKVYSTHAYQEAEKESSSSRYLAKIKQVFSVIEERYQQPLTLEALAESVHMDKKYFCRFFGRITHTTPMKYLQFYRIERACDQLRHSDASIMEVALSTGFSTPEYFSRVFHQQKGMTPSEYIRRLEKEE